MKTKMTCLVILVNSALISSLFTLAQLPEDGMLNFTELGFKYGHNVEEHIVVTEDGYILTVFRIPNKNKTPVMLMHGTADSADTYIIRGNRSLAISLANEGYDVWAVNGRGNRYSRRHIKLNPDTDSEFWNFSYHERGYYDLAVTIDYILQTTGESGVLSIGHSQGSTNNLVLLSTRPEYNDKIKLFIALAPIAFLDHLVPPVSLVTELIPSLYELASLLPLKIDELGGSIFSNIYKVLCTQGIMSYFLCVLIGMFPINGYDTQRLEPNFLPIIIGHVPAGDSTKGLVHHIQATLSKKFAFYDYGPMKNMKVYGDVEPPEYKLRQITAKVVLIVGKNDNMSRVQDVERLRKLLPNVVKYHLMKQEKWNHLDFVWGNDMAETLFPVIFALLKEYS